MLPYSATSLFWSLNPGSGIYYLWNIWLIASFLSFFFWCGPVLKSSLNLLQYSFCFTFWFFGQEACGISDPQPGIEPVFPTLEGEVLNTGPQGKSLGWFLNLSTLQFRHLWNVNENNVYAIELL